ncbi:MAG: hypothetical protein KatS3mg115_0181 [Candidatus Poribacteria bacterium]|nr:MAG: hypothetical protein KatS3mg115_0181 [Candidatus Poribacteria bacterium]
MRSLFGSGYLAYYVRGFGYLGAGALVGIGVAALLSWAMGGYGMARHALSWIAALCVVANLPFALRRRRWIVRFGHQARWLKTHWFLGGVALALIGIHSALNPVSRSGWLVFVLALGILLAGLVAHFTRRYPRRYAVRVHFFFVAALVLALGLHAVEKYQHPWFPLRTPTQEGEVVHDVACAVCHTVRNAYREYSCLGCHAHNTPEIAEVHELHGVPDWSRCLDCHRATIGGKRYSTGTLGRFVPGDVFGEERFPMPER